MTKARKLLLAVPLLLAGPQVGNAVITTDNCYVDDQYGNPQYFNAQYFNAGCAAAGGVGSSSGKRQKGVTLPGVSMN